MTLEVLIHSIVRQTTMLIARLATSGGARAPLASIADQTFLQLVSELDRLGVSRRVSAGMFNLGLRTYQRKIQRLSEGRTRPGPSLWDAVLEHVRSRAMVTRADVLVRFASDDEAQVRAVLHDLSETRLIFSSGGGSTTVYRAATDTELAELRRMPAADGLDELVWTLVYQRGPATIDQILDDVTLARSDLDRALARLVETGCLELAEDGDERVYRSPTLVIPLDASTGWEGAVLDHLNAVIGTVTARLSDARPGASGTDCVGGSTYSLDVWEGHPMAEDVRNTLARLRTQLSEQRARVEDFNAAHGVPEKFTRVVLYAGQNLLADADAGRGDPV